MTIAHPKLAVILAGGLSRRMGYEKSFCNLMGKTMLEWIIAKLSPNLDAIAINANANVFGQLNRFNALSYPIISDLEIKNHIAPNQKSNLSNVGPLIGILTALTWAKTKEAEWVLTTSCDCPNIPYNLYEQLYKTYINLIDNPMPPVVISASSFGRNHPTIALWRVTLAAKLQQALEQGIRKIEDFTKDLPRALVDFSQAMNADNDKNLVKPNEIIRAAIENQVIDPFYNINNQTELRAWLNYQQQLNQTR